MLMLHPELRQARDEDVPALRLLVNAAYEELADLGLNFTGTYQDEAITRDRMRKAEVFLLTRDSKLIASISLSVKDIGEGDTSCLYINQLAVLPEFKRQGIGTYLLKFAEERAMFFGLERLRLDTAIPATHLVEVYRTMGYQEIDTVQWKGKTYSSYIMEKRLCSLKSDATAQMQSKPVSD
jgi:predicted N-acetyltransferase YhbS